MRNNAMMTTSKFEAIATHAGLVDRSDRVRLEISGPDRAKFLHNLTTNDIKRLAVGRGCEAFVTSPQGKTIGYLIVLAADGKLIARADPGGDVLALPHFRKYGVFDDVAIDDRSSSTFELHLFGPHAAEVVRRAAGLLPEEEYAHIFTEIGGHAVRLVCESPAMRPGLTVIGERPAARPVKESLLEHGQISACSKSTPPASTFCASKREHPSSAPKSPRKTSRKKSPVTRARSISSKGATWARRPSPASTPWGTSTSS
jgi:folate-binding Fe-S cluster repair protein YgfZ